MMYLEMITAPLIGGIIGLVTNGIAIRMLFRPLKPVYIGKFKLPFTPGIIPKERDRIAASIGTVVSEQLLDTDTLKKALLTEEIKKHMYHQMDEWFYKCFTKEETLLEVLDQSQYSVPIKNKIDQVKDEFTLRVVEELSQSNLGETMLDIIIEEVISKLNHMILALAKGAIESAREPLAHKIDELIMEKSGPLIEEFIDEKLQEVYDTPIKDISINFNDKTMEIKDYIYNLYVELVERKLNDILKKIDIAKVIETKIREFDLFELEKLILSIIKKELNAIVLLGGLLGLIMGFLNLL